MMYPTIKHDSPLNRIKKHWQLYLLIMLPVVYLFIFNYIPMYGATLAFKEFDPIKGIIGSPWIGLQNFKRFFSSPSSFNIIYNTLAISLYSLVVGLPFPILLAIALNEARVKWFGNIVQMVTYAPYFISTVVMVAMIMQWTDFRTGMFNNIIKIFGIPAIDFMGRPEFFRSIYVWTGIWQFTGFSSIIYIASLAGIDQELYEAATVDGASKLKKIWHIDLPGIYPTIVIILILNVGQVMNIGFDKVYLMQNALNTPISEVIATYTYKIGLQQMDFSYSTAIGLFNSSINFILIIVVNAVARKIGEVSLW